MAAELWPRCPDCGMRAPSADQLARHRLRRCYGPPRGPLAPVKHGAVAFLAPKERAA